MATRTSEYDSLLVSFAYANNHFQVWTAGQVIGLIHDIPTCDELVKRIEREAIETLNKASALYTPESRI